MRVSFDFGTQDHIDLNVIQAAMSRICSEANDLGMKAGKCCVYLNFFDEDGIMQEYVRESDGATVDVVVRKNPYKKKPANIVEVGPIQFLDKSTGEIEVAATIYKKYSK